MESFLENPSISNDRPFLNRLGSVIYTILEDFHFSEMEGEIENGRREIILDFENEDNDDEDNQNDDDEEENIDRINPLLAPFLRMNRSFDRFHSLFSDTDDYEELLLLDRNNVSKGATKTQIESLTVGVFTISIDQKSCSICMDDFEVGEKINILPCLDKVFYFFNLFRIFNLLI